MTDLASIAQLITAIAAFGSMLLAWRAASNSKKAAANSKIAVAKVEEVRHETNSMRATLEQAAFEAGGRAEQERAAG